MNASPSASSCRSALGARTSSPSSRIRVSPQMIIVPMPKMNAYVGMAKATPGLPDPAQVDAP